MKKLVATSLLVVGMFAVSPAADAQQIPSPITQAIVDEAERLKKCADEWQPSGFVHADAWVAEPQLADSASAVEPQSIRPKIQECRKIFATFGYVQHPDPIQGGNNDG